MVVLLAMLAASVRADVEISKKIKECSVRIKAWREEVRQDAVVTISDHGGGVSVDLSEFGIPGKGYVLTAYHVVNSKIPVTIEVETPVGWIRADIMFHDALYDLCLLRLKLPDVLPNSIPLALLDPEPQDQLATMGSPRGQPMRPSQGKHIEMNDSGTAIGSMTIDHGNSGGPVFEKNGRIVGVILSGEAPDAAHANQLLPGRSHYMPVSAVRKFIAFSIAIEGKKWESDSASQK